MALQTVITELDVTMAHGLTTTLTKSCGKQTGTIGSETDESQEPSGIITVSGIIPDCPDPVPA